MLNEFFFISSLVCLVSCQMQQSPSTASEYSTQDSAPPEGGKLTSVECPLGSGGKLIINLKPSGYNQRSADFLDADGSSSYRMNIANMRSYQTTDKPRFHWTLWDENQFEEVLQLRTDEPYVYGQNRKGVIYYKGSNYNWLGKEIACIIHSENPVHHYFTPEISLPVLRNVWRGPEAPSRYVNIVLKNCHFFGDGKQEQLLCEDMSQLITFGELPEKFEVEVDRLNFAQGRSSYSINRSWPANFYRNLGYAVRTKEEFQVLSRSEKNIKIEVREFLGWSERDGYDVSTNSNIKEKIKFQMYTRDLAFELEALTPGRSWELIRQRLVASETYEEHARMKLEELIETSMSLFEKACEKFPSSKLGNLTNEAPMTCEKTTKDNHVYWTCEQTFIPTCVYKP